jgi:N-methylhydantoinase A
MTSTARYRVAADVGGTFTDIALLGADGLVATHKLLSTPANYADAVVAGIVALMAELRLPIGDIEEVLHGCTVAANAILEGKGARTALLTTKGFRDVLELRRIRTPRLYDPLYVKPEPLVPRHLRFEIDERLDARGEILRPLDLDGVHDAVEHIRSSGVEAVAVCFLHSFVNPAHERAAVEILRRELPGLFISASIEVLPQIREYERTSTTVVNAYIGPPVKTYLRSMLDQLGAAGAGGRLMIMQSSGGVLDARAVLDMPAQVVECGPAAGVVGAAHLSAANGYGNVITFDMGGTTAKASIVVNGELIAADGYEVGGGMSSTSKLVGGGGYALALPVIDISEVGAGGGSIVWLDKALSIKVGPQSAGAIPGPACYALGGEEPTVTDANVVLGYLNPHSLARGTVPIEAHRAQAAIETRVARPLSRGLLDTAYGIHIVANASMIRAIKAVTTYRGHDPRDFALMAFGGNGGVHGVALACELKTRRVIVPTAAGVFSAVGLLMANLELNLSRAFPGRTATLDRARAERIYGEIEAELVERLGHPRSAVTFRRLVDMRYAGQAFELMVPLPEGALDADAIEALGQRFEQQHALRYGHSFEGAYPFETVNLRVIGSVVTGGPRRIRGSTRAEPLPAGSRSVYFGPGIGSLETPVISRGSLSAEARPGPLVIEDYEGTVVVPPLCTARVDSAASILIDLPPP